MLSMHLRVSCAGIRRAATFSKSLRIAAVDGEREGYEQIQMRAVGRQAGPAATKSQSVVTNRTYGAVVHDRTSQRSTLVDMSAGSALVGYQLQRL